MVRILSQRRHRHCPPSARITPISVNCPQVAGLPFHSSASKQNSPPELRINSGGLLRHCLKDSVPHLARRDILVLS